jgi:hypothetical protein
MSVEITKHFVDQYRGNLETLVRQKGSRLRGAVRVESINGKQSFFDQIGETTANEQSGRHQDIEYSDTEHARRMVTTKLVYSSDLVDGADKIRMLADPTNEYAKAQADAIGKKIDDVILAAMLGTAYTGETGTTQTAYDTNMTVANNVRESGATDAALGLNVAKLRKAKELLDANEVDEDARFIAPNARQMTSLLSSTKATSADYAAVKALVQGEINTFMGFTFLRSQRIAFATYDKVPFWHRSGVLLALGQDLRTSMDYIKTKVSHPLQVYSDIDVGATRMQEKLVGYIECHATAGPGSVN